MFLTCIGNVSWWAAALNTEILTLSTGHRFQKQCELSQYHILGPNGPLLLSVPLQKAGRNGAYDAVCISYENDWQTEHWRSIETAYSKAPFFIYYNYIIAPVFKAEYDKLTDFNKAVFQCLCKCMNIRIAVLWDEENPVHYSDTELKPIPAYPQVFDDRFDFVPNLSLLDLLFNLGPEVVEYLRRD